MKFPRIPRLLVPLVVLVAASAAIAFALHRASGGNEIADDVVTLARMVRDPFVLWRDYRAAGLSDNWGSFPPLLPPVFSLLVAPWLRIAGGFWGFRLGVLSWTIAALFVLDALLRRAGGIPEERRRGLLLLFVLLPSVLGAIALIPQEEIYVSLFAAALYAAAAAGRWKLVPFLFVAAALAGKYFLLVLVPAAAFVSPAPWRRAAAWSALALGALAAYAAYHRIAHGLSPIVSHDVDPGSCLSIWALAWNVGFQPPQRAARAVSLVLAAVFALVFSRRSAARGRPLSFTFSGTIVGALMLLSVSYPGYILWAAPILPVAIGLMKRRPHRIGAAALAVLWGAGEWGANFFRGVALALGADRPAGKETLAAFAERLLGRGFPYGAAHVGFLCLVLAAGCGLLYILSTAPAEEEAFGRRGANQP